MGKFLVLWGVAITVVLALLGIWVITGESGHETAAPSLFTKGAPRAVPPIPAEPDAREPAFEPGP